MCRVSIIIPVYNVADYIVRCLESVVAQETAAIDLECILVDDCSPDHSISLARDFVCNYTGKISFVFLEHKLNKGQSAARNTGVLAAKGDYLMFLDADDHLCSQCVEKFLSSVALHPDADVVDAVFYHCEDKKNYPHIEKTLYLTDKKKILDFFYKGKVSLCAWNKLLRKDFFLSHSLFFAEGIMFEDIQWSNRLFHVVSSILILPDVTYYYEYNPLSTMNTTHVNATKSVRSFICVINDLLNTPEKEVYIDHKLFIFHYILNAMDIQTKGYVDEEVRNDFKDIKSRLFHMTLCDGRIVLSVFFLLMYQPFYRLLKFSFVRHHLHEAERVVSILANFFSFFHK